MCNCGKFDSCFCEETTRPGHERPLPPLIPEAIDNLVNSVENDRPLPDVDWLPCFDVPEVD